MLQTLIIKNYALISHLEIDFEKGFSVITGETGAGKSIILGALSLILGNRADTKSVKDGETRCYIEGIFDISTYPLKHFFDERGIDWDNPCILRREIWSSGKSRAFINDNPVALSDLKELGECLIDIHSQHQNLLLADRGFQLQVLDMLAANQALRDGYAESYEHYFELCSRRDELTEKARMNTAEEDFLHFQFQQLDDAKLIPDEQEELERDRDILSNVEEIKNHLYHIEQNLIDDNRGALATLKEALAEARNLSKIYPEAEDIVTRIETAFLDLKDLAGDATRQQDHLESDPARLQAITERLDLLYSLQQKHKADSIDELIATQEILAARLNDIDHYDQRLAHLDKEVNTAHEKLLEAAGKLSASRQKAIKNFEKDLISKASLLGMPNIQFRIQLTKHDEPDRTGMDKVEYLFAADRNSALRPVTQIASGGEVARLMLTIKALVAGRASLPTIVFDEIDTGVSGEIADRMGEIMHQMAHSMQVLAITHLPQIAAHGDRHYFVYKQEDADSTQTHIRLLSQDERITQLAHMLSGAELTHAALANAQELINKKQ